MMKLSSMRRLVLGGLMLLYALQFAKVKVLVGGLTGSVALWTVKLLDLYAYAESTAAALDFTLSALIAGLPVLGLYLIFGRAFCGWACPMDFIFSLANRLRPANVKPLPAPEKTGYFLAAGFLIASAAVGIPIFTNYLSHMTNFFRAITGGVFLALDLPVDIAIVYWSGGVIAGLVALELAYPRLWCRALCPMGKTYGLLNKLSAIRLNFTGEPCGQCMRCEEVCYMGVPIARHAEGRQLRHTGCIYCGLCVEGCNTKNKLISISLKGASRT